jgi:GLPGLI family protein
MNNKKLPLITLLLMFLVPSLGAQISSGTIDYNERYYFEMGDWVSKERKEEIKKQMADGEFDRVGRVTFNEEAFSYQQLPVENTGGGGRGSWWMMRNQENPDIYYTNLQDSTVTDRRRVMDRAFIMQDKWIAPEWNIAKADISMREIPLPTKLATAISIEGDTLTAYYTPSIPVSVGPRGYGGLPGAIVYLKVANEGRYTEYKMLTMQPSGEALEIERPADEQVVTREKFEKEMARAREMAERRRRSWRRGRN